LAAVRGGQCIDTTMGLTPTGGLVMGTRTGDIDPGVLLYLARHEHLSPDQLEDLVNRRSGLLGISETSPDVRDLLLHRANDSRAAEAIELFCYQTRKWIGALGAALGGLETLVFSGGIGENSPPIREDVCRDLGFLGVHLDSSANAASAAVISAAGNRVAVRIIPTDEERMIARIALRMMNDPTRTGSPS
jgi:acetate kinase